MLLHQRLLHSDLLREVPKPFHQFFHSFILYCANTEIHLLVVTE